MTTITEIALRAEVSPSTVSRVLRDHPQFKVSAACRSRINKIARELNYEPQLAGRSLVSGKSYTIVMVLGDMDRDLASPFFAQTLAALGQTLWTKGYALALLPVNARHRQTLNNELMRVVRGSRADGFIIPQMFLNSCIINLLRERHVPVVTFVAGAQTSTFGNEISEVLLDERPAAGDLAKALAQLDHQRILYFMPTTSHAFRYKALQAALRHEGIAVTTQAYTPPFKGFLHDREYARSTAAASMHKLIRYSAIVCSSDLVALGVMDALHEQGLEAGRDISVVGYDNIEENANFIVARPFLATIDRRAYACGSATAELLLERIEQPDRPLAARIVPTRFIQRMSLARAKKMLK